MRKVFLRLWDSPVVMTWGNLAAKSSSLLILLPLILTQFESEDIVVWYVFATIISLQMLIDFGFTPTLSRLVSYAHGGASVDDIYSISKKSNHVSVGQKTPDLKVVSTVYSTSKLTFVGLAFFAFVFSASVGTWLVNDALDNSTAPEESWFAWWFVLVIASITLYGNTYVSLLQGMDRIALVQRVQMFFSLASVLTAMIALVLNQEILVVVLSFYLWNLLNVLANYYFTRETLGRKYLTGSFNTDLFREVIWPNSWKSGVGVLLSLGLIQLSALIVTKLAAPAVAASYMISLQLVRAASSFSQAPFYSKLPTLGRLFVQGEKGALIAMARTGMQKSISVFVVIVLFVALFGEVVLTFIGSNADFPSTVFWFVIGLAFLFERIGVLYLQLYTLTGDVIWHTANGLTGLFIIFLSIILFPILGVLALPLSMLIAYALFFTAYTSWKSYRAYGQFVAVREITLLFVFFVFFELVIISFVGLNYV